MTKEELIAKLRELPVSLDREAAHEKADALLVEYINDAEVADAYNALEKWYA